MPNPAPTVEDRIRAAWNARAPHHQWITEIGDGYMVVCDELDGRAFYRVPVAAAGDSVEFGEPVKVTSGWVAASGSVVYASRAESRPDTAADPAEPDVPDTTTPADPDPDTTADPGTPEPPAAEPDNNTTDPEEDPVPEIMSGLRSRLGLADTATEADVLAAVDQLTDLATRPAASDEQIAAAAEKAKHAEQVAAAAEEMKTEIARLSGELATIKAASAAETKRNLFDEAVQSGRISPAQRGDWESRYDRAPEVIGEILASLAPNTAVPVAASGYTGTTETAGDMVGEFSANTVAELFGDTTITTQGV